MTKIVRQHQRCEAKKKLKYALNFKEVQCDSLVGEALQDAAVRCYGNKDNTDKECVMLALYGHGRRTARCHITGETTADVMTVTGQGTVRSISQTWLRHRDSLNRETFIEVGVHNVGETVETVSIDPTCDNESGQPRLDCSIVGTSHSRIVELRSRSNGVDLVPANALVETSSVAPLSRVSQVRAFNSRYLGLFQPNRQSIQILDMNDGGTPSGRLLLPSSPVRAFCAGGGFMYLLLNGSDPEIWRIPLPRDLLPDAQFE